MRRIETKGAKHGRCNICGEDGPLTEDHTPPKCCRGISAGEIRSLIERLSRDGGAPRTARRVQSGVSYRTLCRRCNSEKLGGEYDPALAEFCEQVRHVASSVLDIPTTLRLRIKPQRVMRSVLGHMAAQGVDRYFKGPITEPLRDYILGESNDLPANIRLYYWLYPYRHQVLVRDAVRINMGHSDPVLFWLMKFYPLAFLATFDEQDQDFFRLTSLHPYGREPLNASADVAVITRPVRHELWPEAPDSDGAILYGPQAHFATPGYSPSRRS